MSPPVQELLNAHKLVRLCCLPLRGRHAQWSCPTNVERTLAVGRDGSARRCRSCRLRTNLSPCTVCRFADGGDMSPPYKRVHGNDNEGNRSAFLNRAKHTTVLHP